jgi:pimeloyl-ACP methyl ester carboxylesterase
MGGQVALDFTLAHPEMVDALILVATVLTDRPPSDTLLQQFSRIGEALQVGDVTRANEIELDMWVNGPYRSTHEVVQTVRERVCDMNAIKWSRRGEEAQPMPLDPPAATRLDELKVPTLIVVGDLDQPEVLDSAERLTKSITRAQSVVITGSAHLPSMEQPAQFSRAVSAFLKNIAGTQPATGHE